MRTDVYRHRMGSAERTEQTYVIDTFSIFNNRNRIIYHQSMNIKICMQNEIHPNRHEFSGVPMHRHGCIPESEFGAIEVYN